MNALTKQLNALCGSLNDIENTLDVITELLDEMSVEQKALIPSVLEWWGTYMGALIFAAHDTQRNLQNQNANRELRNLDSFTDNFEPVPEN